MLQQPWRRQNQGSPYTALLVPTETFSTSSSLEGKVARSTKNSFSPACLAGCNSVSLDSPIAEGCWRSQSSSFVLPGTGSVLLGSAGLQASAVGLCEERPRPLPEGSRGFRRPPHGAQPGPSVPLPVRNRSRSGVVYTRHGHQQSPPLHQQASNQFGSHHSHLSTGNPSLRKAPESFVWLPCRHHPDR